MDLLGLVLYNSFILILLTSGIKFMIHSFHLLLCYVLWFLLMEMNKYNFLTFQLLIRKDNRIPIFSLNEQDTSTLRGIGGVWIIIKSLWLVHLTVFYVLNFYSSLFESIFHLFVFFGDFQEILSHVSSFCCCHIPSILFWHLEECKFLLRTYCYWNSHFLN